MKLMFVLVIIFCTLLGLALKTEKESLEKLGYTQGKCIKRVAHWDQRYPKGLRGVHCLEREKITVDKK